MHSWTTAIIRLMQRGVNNLIPSCPENESTEKEPEYLLPLLGFVDEKNAENLPIVGRQKSDWIHF